MTGASLRSEDAGAIALCVMHHHNLHTLSGPFRGWTKARRKAWEAQRVAHFRELWERRLDLEPVSVTVAKVAVF
jgi:hypothetical protein